MDNQRIAFSLPITCHICLGKVRQPVTCSRQHVFCLPCLEVWLDRVPHCPTCRTPINEESPYRPVIGGVHAETQGEQSWDLLRARIEISLREYESELESRSTRNQVLENENRALLEKLASQHTQPDNVADFTVLNEELKTMKDLYDKSRREVSELKRRNEELTDARVHLLREASILRTEISSRSPQKFGRITVATLQSKLDDREKEVKQLQKALEKSDEYVTELQKQLDSCTCRRETINHAEKKLHEDLENSLKLKCQRNLMSSLEESSNETSQPQTDNADSADRAAQSADSADRAAQFAALRVASGKIQAARPSASSDSPFTLVRPSTSDSSVSPTKRARQDDVM